MRYIVKAMRERYNYVMYIQRHLPSAEIVYDRGLGLRDTFQQAWMLAGNDPCVQMEEDVILTQGFEGKVEEAVAERPDVVIQFFSMRKADLTIGSRWDRSFMMNQCTYMPPGYCRMLLEYAGQWPGWVEHPSGTDNMIQQWLRSRKERYWIHVPSLVDHRQGKSMLGKRSSRRQSLTFVEPIV